MINPTNADDWQTPRIEAISDAVATSDQQAAPIRNGNRSA